jgi:PAS domain S-box-containing protein
VEASLEIASLATGSGNESHFVRFYDQDEIMLEEVADFLDIPLRAGGASIIIATVDHISILRRHLAGLGTHAEASPWFTGELLVFEAEDMLARFMQDDWPDEERFNDTVGKVVRQACQGNRTVHAFGEMVAILCSQGLHDAAIRLEQLWNGLHEHLKFSLFCAYPWNVFSSVELVTRFQQVCREHGHVYCHPQSSRTVKPQELHLRAAELEQQNRALQGELSHANEAIQTLRYREQELADFVNNAAEGLHRVGSDGTILWANKAELAMLGYRWEDYVGHHIAEFHVDQPLIEGMLARIQAGAVFYDQPAQLRCQDGSVKHVLIHSNGCFVDGKLRYTRCSTRDATDRLRLEEAYREREELLTELTRMNQAKDEFLAMLSHELRNPLAPISAAAESLQAMAADPVRVKEIAAVVARQAGHLTALLDDLLDVARVTRGLIKLSEDQLDLRDVVSAAIEQVTPMTRTMAHDVAVRLPGEAAYVRGDVERLVQVVTNIVTNAAKYTPAGGRLDVELSVDGAQAELKVADNGIGMAPELVDKVFQLFVQGERSSNRSQGGLGVGLALVRSLVRAHGGTVHAESAGPGRGSTFIVHLPLLPQAEVQHAAAVALAQPAPPRPLRIMIVDDNVDAAQMLAILLEMAGHQVQLAHTGGDALRAAEATPPDVFLLDIGLPDMDGRELAAHLRTVPALAQAHVIAISGYGQAHDRQQAMAAGFDHHLVKPVRIEELTALLEQGRPPAKP